MNTKNIFRAALSMTAALMMTACSSDDINKVTPQGEGKIIPFEATVNGGALTRATVDDDNKTLKFATGDKLYVTGTNISGVLDIQTGTGTASATFSGDLTYTGSGSPAADLALTATLVSAQQTVGTEVSVDGAGAVTVNYPTTAYCDDVSTAVQKYSNLTGTSTYGAKSFSLTQQTAFLNFVITFEDGTTTGTELSAVVSNGGSAICTANVTTVTESTNVVAKFVLPVASGTTLSSANVKMGTKEAISFGASQTLTGKVYNVTKMQAAPARALSEATTDDIGKIAGLDGKIYDNADAATTAGTTAVAMIAYVGSGSDCTHGLAIALEKASSETLSWDNSGTNNDSKTAAEWCSAWNTSKPVTGGTWRLPSKADWQNMFVACAVSGDASAGDTMNPITGYMNKIKAAAPTPKWSGLSNVFWTSTEYISDKAWYVSVNLSQGNAYFRNSKKNSTTKYVLCCLAF